MQPLLTALAWTPALLTAPAQVPFRHVVVDADPPRDPHCKAAGDIDGDGKDDVLAASASGGGLFWYHAPDWAKHRIAEGTFTTDMEVGDVDGDGHLDVVIPSNDGLMLYRNPMGHGGDPAKDAWEAVNVSPDGARMHDVDIVDLDGDGRLDLVTRHQSGFGKKMGNQIHLWRQLSPTEWTHRTFDCPHGEGLRTGDIDGDGHPDVITGGRWYRNPGDPWTGAWTEHLYLPAADFDQQWTNGDCKVDVGDLDGDGRPEIVITPAEGKGRLSWFKAPADPRSPDWQQHMLAELDHTHAVVVGDFDGDGQLDIAAAKMHQATPPQEVWVLLNQGGAKGWTKQVLGTTGSHNICLIDVDGSGRLSVFGANWNSKASSTGGALELWVSER